MGQLQIQVELNGKPFAHRFRDMSAIAAGIDWIFAIADKLDTDCVIIIGCDRRRRYLLEEYSISELTAWAKRSQQLPVRAWEWRSLV